VLFASNDGDWNEDSENSAVDCGDASFQVSVHLIRDQVYKLEERVTGHVDLSFVVAEQAIEPALNNLQVLHSMSGAGGCALPLPGQLGLVIQPPPTSGVDRPGTESSGRLCIFRF